MPALTEIIFPNWHIAIVHFPITLVVVGVLAELGAALGGGDRLRTFARWTLFLGLLTAILSAVTGLYAWRDAVAPGEPIDLHHRWRQVSGEWSPEQTRMIARHAWLNGSAVALLLGIAVLWEWLGREDRRGLYGILLVLALVATGLLAAGAWHGGEAVYRLGTAVAPTPAARTAGPPISILQLHIVLAGTAAAAVAGAYVLHGHHSRRLRPVEPGSALPLPASVRGAWLGTAALLAATALIGARMVMGGFDAESLRSNLDSLGDPKNRRLLMHSVSGTALLLLALGGAAVPRRIARGGAIAVCLGGLLLLALASQVWSGAAMLFDSHHGPLFELSRGPAGAGGHSSHASHEVENAATVVVEMSDSLTYEPREVRVRSGDTVRWVNVSEVEHTVTADASKASNPDSVRLPGGVEAFDSGEIAPGRTWERVFEVPGRYRYFCIPHESEGMVGDVFVEEPGGDGER